MGLCVPRSTTAVKNMTNVTTYYGLMYFTHYCQDDMHDFNLLPPVQRSYGKVMFLQVSVILLGGGVLCDHYPRCFGPHYTGPSSPSPAPQTYGIGPPPDMGHGTPGTPPLDMGPLLLVTFGGHQQRPVQTSSLEDTPPVLTSGGHQNP